MRPLCKICNQRPAAINYKRKSVTYYRISCSFCIAKKKKLPNPIPQWATAGYKKKTACDLCGFRSKYQSQLVVAHCDGNMHNNQLANLRTICLNCIEEVKRADNPWAITALKADYRYSHKDRPM